MGSYTVKGIDELETIHHGAVKLAAASLGVQSFGMQVLDFPAGFSDYPAHDHSEDGQEELYFVLRGSAELEVDGDRVSVRTGDMARVAADAKRNITPGSAGVRILAIGVVGDRPYVRPEGFRLEVNA